MKIGWLLIKIEWLKNSLHKLKKREKQERLMKQKNFAKFMIKYLSNCTNNAELLRQKS